MPIMIVGMLDERDDAIRVIKEQIENRGHRTIVVDISIGTGVAKPSVQADLHSPDLIAAGGEAAPQISPSHIGYREIMASLLSKGLAAKVASLHRSGAIDGIIAIGGMTGTLIALKGMKVLPFGFPKVIISSGAALPAHAEQLAEYFGSMDVTVMHAVFDTVGMNRAVKALAVNGAKAISGMVEGLAASSEESCKPLLAITEFGLCDQGAYFLREALEPEYEIIFVHATGVGDRSLITLAPQGYFGAIIDLVPDTFSEWLLGGNRPSGEDRLDVAKDLLIPYVFCPGGFDLISCGPMDRKSKSDPLWERRRLAERKLHSQDDLRVQARMSSEESVQVAMAVAARLNEYTRKERVKVVIPEKGFTSLSVENGPLHDPVADRAFITTLESHLSKEIEVRKADTDINSREFAEIVARALADAQKACR